MKIKTIIRIIIAVVLLVFLFLFLKNVFQKQESDVEVTHQMIVTQMEDLGRMEVLKYTISDIITYTKHRDWLPNSSVALLVVGEVIACVDMSQLRAEDVVLSGKSIRITLPIPEVCTFKIDHSRSKVYDVKYGLWKTHQLVDEAYKDAERQLYKQAMEMGMAKESQENARKTITTMLQLFGFDAIDIHFHSSTYQEGKGMKISK